VNEEKKTDNSNANNSDANNSIDKENFLYPTSPYRGKFTPENLVINANLQEFAQRVSYICNLETNGKLSTQEAYLQIKALWKDLRKSVKNLGIDEKK
jgi:hypothetical protein